MGLSVPGSNEDRQRGWGGRRAPDSVKVTCAGLWLCRYGQSGVSHRPCDAGVGKCGQVTKGARWMSWHREATKDVVACDKLREAGKRALIRRFLNGETQRERSRYSHLNV